MTPSQIDSWHATLTRRVEQIRLTLIGLIRDGTEQELPLPRKPTAAERLSQDRRDGHFNPTTPGHARQPHQDTDTVLAGILRWETDIEYAVTLLIGTVGEIWTTLEMIGVTVLPPPKEPPTRRSSNGRPVICAAPATALHLVHTHTRWLDEALGKMADRIRVSPDDDRARHLERLTRTLSHQLGVEEIARGVETI